MPKSGAEGDMGYLGTTRKAIVTSQAPQIFLTNSPGVRRNLGAPTSIRDEVGQAWD